MIAALPPALQSPAVASDLDAALASFNIVTLRCLLYLIRLPGEHAVAAIARGAGVSASHCNEVLKDLLAEKFVFRRAVGSFPGRPRFLYQLAA
jgi:predicted transcriptional regulator